MTSHASQNLAFPGRVGGPLRHYRAGEAFTAAMSAPDHASKCVDVGRAPQVAFLIKNAGGASGVTAFTIHYGRWVSTETEDRQVPTSHRITGAWVEDGIVAITLATDDKYIPVPPFATQGDLVGIYVTDLTGSVSGDGQTFKFWFRELG